MNLNNLNQYGNISLSFDVLTSIVGMALEECYGVVGMASRNVKDGIVDLLKKDNLHKGVKVRNEEGKMIIDLHVIIEYGVKISEVAKNIMDKVKYNLENYTGLKVDKINIYVESIRVDK